MGEVPDLSSIRPVPVRVHADPRGELWKVLTGSALDDRSAFGEIYLAFSHGGVERGNHYHEIATEWFLVLRGRMLCRLAVPGTGDKTSFVMEGENPAVLKVPAGIAHGFIVEGEEPAVLLAYADREYDEQSPDTIPYEF